MPPVDAVADEIDRLSRRLLRNVECCDRLLVARRLLTISQAHTLQVIGERGETTMYGLAEEMRLHGTTMTRMVDALVAKGLVERATSAKDRRIVRVRLTSAGLEAMADLRLGKRGFLAETLEGVPEQELRTMVGALRELVSLAERWGAQCARR